jgi:hypothetical protein
MITILFSLLALMVSPSPCRVSRGSSVGNLFHQGLAASTSRRIPGSPRPSALTHFANLAISGSCLDLLSTTPQPRTAIQNA